MGIKGGVAGDGLVVDSCQVARSYIIGPREPAPSEDRGGKRQWVKVEEVAAVVMERGNCSSCMKYLYGPRHTAYSHPSASALRASLIVLAHV